MEIKHLPYSKIDRAKWEKVILHAVNGNVYGFSWYLDIVCETWDALVLNDYEAVMPLPVKKFMGYSILQQPLFTQQLGVFSPNIQLIANIHPFIEYTQQHFHYISLQFNKLNVLSESTTHALITKKNNFELDLIPPYTYLWNKFHTNTKRNILKAQKNKLTVKINDINADTFIQFLKKNMESKVIHLSNKDYEKIKHIVTFSLKYKFGEIYSVYDKTQLVSSVLFIFTHQKAFYLFAVSSPVGKEKKAMFLLLDEFIRKYAEKNVILDFEGSMIPGVARFYESFGATNCSYVHYYYNALPFFLRLIKH